MRFALLRYVPTRFRTLERCLKFVRQNPENLLHVPAVHYEHSQFSYWSRLYWASVVGVVDLSHPKFEHLWPGGLIGVDFFGNGSESRRAKALLQAPWRDEAVCLAYVKTSSDTSELRPADLTDAIYLKLMGREVAAEFINHNQCDLVYDFMNKHRNMHNTPMMNKLSNESIRWMESKGYFDGDLVFVYALSPEKISEEMIVKLLPSINYIQANNVLKHPSFLRLYFTYHGIDPADHGRAAVQLMGHLLSAYGAYSRPIQSMLIAHADAIFEMAPNEFTEFLLDGLMSLRNNQNDKGLGFHPMVVKYLSEQLRYCEEFGFEKYMSMLRAGALNNIQALHQWGHWYFKIHRLDEIVAWCNDQDTWKLAMRYASRETLEQHAQGRRLLLEQDLEL